MQNFYIVLCYLKLKSKSEWNSTNFKEEQISNHLLFAVNFLFKWSTNIKYWIFFIPVISSILRCFSLLTIVHFYSIVHSYCLHSTYRSSSHIDAFIRDPSWSLFFLSIHQKFHFLFIFGKFITHSKFPLHKYSSVMNNLFLIIFSYFSTFFFWNKIHL